MSDGKLRVVVLHGSVRPGSFSRRAAALVVDELERDAGVEVAWIEPASLPLAPPGVDSGRAAADRLQASVTDADAVLVVTPEYHGSYSSVTKLIIDSLGFPSMLSGKPVALLGVAAGRIGAIKALEHLRSVCAHVGAIVLPGSVSVAQVRSRFDDDGRCNDPELESRIRGVGRGLVDYVRGRS